MRLVRQIHEELGSFLKGADYAIDATLGNGHDTLFLAQLVKRVIGFDIQGTAIENTRSLLLRQGALEKVTLVHRGHEHMAEYVPAAWKSNVKAIFFNLGYLPNGDKTVITRPQSTLRALDQSLGFLSVCGYLSIVLYPNHEGGSEEASAVRKWFERLDERTYEIKEVATAGPSWVLAWRKN